MLISAELRLYGYTYYTLMIMICFGIAFMYAFVVYELNEKLSTFFKKMFDKSN